MYIGVFYSDDLVGTEAVYTTVSDVTNNTNLPTPDLMRRRYVGAPRRLDSWNNKINRSAAQ